MWGNQPCAKSKSCVTTSVNSQAAIQSKPAPIPHQCRPGPSWNGAACIAQAQQCPAGARWNGASCVQNAALCRSFTSRAATITTEARAIRSQMQQACMKDSNSPECIRLTQEYDGDVLRYRNASERSSRPDHINLPSNPARSADTLACPRETAGPRGLPTL